MTIFELIVSALFALIVCPLIAFMLYALFILMPVSALADAECKAKGYPKAEVTYNLRRYCMNLDGSVTVKLEELH